MSRAAGVLGRGDGGVLIDYYAYSSGIRGWNPTLKVVFSLAVIIVCIAAAKPLVSLSAIALCGVVTVYKGCLPLRRYLRLLLVPLSFILLGAAAIAINFSRSPMGDFRISLHWFYIYFTSAGLREAGALILKAFGAVSAMFMLTLSTPSNELFTVLKKLYCPKLLVELMSIIYRFIFILLDTQSKMTVSAGSRLGFHSFRASCQTFGQIAGNLLLISLKKSGSYYDAMESRCYTGDISFLLDEPKVGLNEAIWSGGGLLLLLAVWII